MPFLSDELNRTSSAQENLCGPHGMLPFLAEVLPIDNQVLGIIAKFRQQRLQVAVKLRCAHWPYAKKVKNGVSKQAMC